MEREIFYSQVYTPDNCQPVVLGHVNTEARSFIQVQSLGPSSAPFPRPLAESWYGNGADRIQTGTVMGACVAGSGFTNEVTTLVPIGFVFNMQFMSVFNIY